MLAAHRPLYISGGGGGHQSPVPRMQHARDDRTDARCESRRMSEDCDRQSGIGGHESYCC